MADGEDEETKARFWPGVAELILLGTMGFVALLVVMTIFVNFLVDEAHQPIDFYSNKLRTRPYWLLIEIVVLGGGLCGVYFANMAKTLNDGLPEIAIACYLEGLAIGMTQLGRVSAASSLTSLCIYGFLAPCLCMITLVPTFPVNRPGIFYSVLYFIVGVIFVFWVKVGVKRHIYVDGHPKILPPGAERLFEVWYEAAFKWNPVLTICTSMAYGVEFLVYKGEYGYASALAYSVVASLILAGCCHQFRTGTELE